MESVPLVDELALHVNDASFLSDGMVIAIIVLA